MWRRACGRVHASAGAPSLRRRDHHGRGAGRPQEDAAAYGVVAQRGATVPRLRPLAPPHKLLPAHRHHWHRLLGAHLRDARWQPRLRLGFRHPVRQHVRRAPPQRQRGRHVLLLLRAVRPRGGPCRVYGPRRTHFMVGQQDVAHLRARGRTLIWRGPHLRPRRADELQLRTPPVLRRRSGM